MTGFSPIALMITLTGLVATVLQATDGTVAVLDFSVPATTATDLSWAAKGIPDLLELELQRRDLDIVDRSLMNAMLSEHRRHQSGVMDHAAFREGSIAPAQHLIRGKVEEGRDGQVIFTAQLIRTSDAVTLKDATASGRLPEELLGLLAELTTSLAGPSNEPKMTSSRPKYEAAPEALLMFYRGMDAYAQDCPEVALAWFMMAERLDPNFAIAEAWQARAYEAGGHREHAYWLREDLRSRGLGALCSGENEVGRGGHAIIHIPRLRLRHDRGENGADTLQANSLHRMLSQAVGALESAAVLDPEALAHASEEQDLALSGLISPFALGSYGRFAAASALLLCREERDVHGSRLLALTLLAAADGTPIGHSAVPIENGLPSPERITEAVRTLLQDHREDATAIGLGLAEGRNARARAGLQLTLADSTKKPLLAPYEGLMLELLALRDEPTGDVCSRHQKLASAFLSLARTPHAVIEIAATVNTFVPSSDRSGERLYALYKWANTRIINPYVEEDHLAKLRRLLQEEFETTSGGIQFALREATEAYERRSYTQALTILETAYEHLKPLTALSSSDHLRNLAAHVLFMRGDCEWKLQDQAAALVSFTIAKGEMEPEVKRIRKRFNRTPERTLQLVINKEVPKWNATLNALSQLTPQTAITADYPTYRNAYTTAWTKKGDQNGWNHVIESVLEYWESDEAGPFPVEGLAEAKDALKRLAGLDATVPLLPLVQGLVHGYLGAPLTESIGGLIPWPTESYQRRLDTVRSLYEQAELIDVSTQNIVACLSVDIPVPRKIRLYEHLGGDIATRLGYLETISKTIEPTDRFQIPASTWAAIGGDCYKAGDYSKALQSYKRALKSPHRKGARNGLGPLLVRMAIEQATSHAPDWVSQQCTDLGTNDWLPGFEQWFNEGITQKNQSNWQEAIACFTEARRLWRPSARKGLSWPEEWCDPTHSASLHLAECHAQDGAGERAAELLRGLVNTLGTRRVPLLSGYQADGRGVGATVSLGIMAQDRLTALRIELAHSSRDSEFPNINVSIVRLFFGGERKNYVDSSRPLMAQIITALEQDQRITCIPGAVAQKALPKRCHWVKTNKEYALKLGQVTDIHYALQGYVDSVNGGSGPMTIYMTNTKSGETLKYEDKSTSGANMTTAGRQLAARLATWVTEKTSVIPAAPLD